MLIYTLIASLLWLPFHELGHYVTARYFGFKPKLNFTPYSVQVRLTIPDSEIFRNKRKAYIVAFMGVVGVIPLLPLVFTVWMPIVFFALYSVFEVINFKYKIKKYLQGKEKAV